MIRFHWLCPWLQTALGATALGALLCGGCGRKPDATSPPTQIAGADLTAAAGDADAQRQPKHGLSKLPAYELKVIPRDLPRFEQSASSNETVPAIFRYDGQSYDIRLRYRGD